MAILTNLAEKRKIVKDRKDSFELMKPADIIQMRKTNDKLKRAVYGFSAVMILAVIILVAVNV